MVLPDQDENVVDLQWFGLDHLAGRQIGGLDACSDCDAHVELVSHGADGYGMEVHHDPECPIYRGVIER